MSDNIKQVRVAGSGVEYTKQKILQTKKKVITKAQLYKIPHNSGKLDLSLRLGRYNIFENTVESDKPRSELTLDNIELEELISYLESDYRPLSIGKGDYLKIENSSVLSILQHIESLKLKSEEVATLLLNSGMLNQDVQFFIEILRKRKSLEEFEKEIQLNKNEQFWQQWFL